MCPIEYTPIMQAYYKGLGFESYPIYSPTGDPWTPLRKPLAQCQIGLVCSAGLSRRDQPPFHPRARDDLSVRAIPLDTPPEELVINYSYFDHRDADADVNCVFPLARLRDLEREGFIGRAAPTAYAMGVGRWRQDATPEKLQNEVAADLVARFREQEVDAVLLIPT